MKALSILQPWAWLIANGYKDIGNRSWQTQFRGRFLIHASKTFDAGGYAWAKRTFPHIPMPEPCEFDLGGIVGEARLIDCVADHPSPWFEGPYGFVLADAKPLEFLRCPERLHFFDVAYEG